MHPTAGLTYVLEAVYADNAVVIPYLFDACVVLSIISKEVILIVFS